MSTWFNVSIALVVFMGLASGGMIALLLMSTRKQQASFSIILGLLVIIAILGVAGSVTLMHDTLGGLSNGIVLLVLAITLGYALTAFSVLAGGKRKWTPNIPRTRNDRTAVIFLAPGEPPEYETRSAAKRLEFADDPGDVPPLLLRPFYMRDIKTKYSAIGSSPYRDSHIELARKVQSRLDSSFNVMPAFYTDTPSLPETLTRAIEEGSHNIVVAHARVADPPDQVLTGDLLEGINPENYGIKLRYTEPLWDSQLLPQVYVRRILEALPELGPEADDAGVLLVGRGHIQSGESAVKRFTQESSFLRRVRDALVRVGFDNSRVAIGWLRHSPSAGASLQNLLNAGCKVVYCLPASFSADGINTLFDINAQVQPIVKASGIKFITLGAWNADDLAAEEIAAYVRAVSPVAARS
ncbi:MAG: ferrochelatase [Chloroflexota bacterium]